jgi:hypothetical protein
LSARTHARYAVVPVSLTCKVFSCSHVSTTLGAFIIHLTSHLEDGSGTTILCPYDSCCRNFGLKLSFSSHLSRKYRTAVPQDVAVAVAAEIDTADADLQEPLDVDSTVLNVDEQNQFVSSIAWFYLKLQARFLLPVTTVQTINDEFQIVHGVGQRHIAASLKNKLALLDVSDDSINPVC